MRFFIFFLNIFHGKRLFKVAKGKIYTRIHPLGTMPTRVGVEAKGA